MANNKKKSKTPSRQARRRAARAAKKKSVNVMSDPRWNFNLKGLSFGDKRSIQQAGPTVGLSEYTDDIQVIMPRVTHEMSDMGQAIDVLSGTEFLFSVNNNGEGSVPGDILATLLIHPLSFFKTRLAQFSELYERYRFRKVNFWYKPSANATQSGQLIGYGDYDPDQILSENTEDNLSIAAAHLGQSVCKIWETRSFPFGIVDNYTSLFTDFSGIDDRLIYQGIYYLLAGSEIDPTVSALGNLYIEYEIEMIIPVLQQVSQVFQAISLSNPNPSTGQTFALPFGTEVEPVQTLSWFASTMVLGQDILYDGVSGRFTIASATIGASFLLVTSGVAAGTIPASTTVVQASIEVSAVSGCAVNNLNLSGGFENFRVTPGSAITGTDCASRWTTCHQVLVTSANPTFDIFVSDMSTPSVLTSPTYKDALLLLAEYVPGALPPLMVEALSKEIREPWLIGARVPCSLSKMKKKHLRYSSWGQKLEHEYKRKQRNLELAKKKEDEARIAREEATRMFYKRLKKEGIFKPLDNFPERKSEKKLNPNVLIGEGVYDVDDFDIGDSPKVLRRRTMEATSVSSTRTSLRK